MNIQITDCKESLNIEFIHDYLCNHSYWARGRNRELVEKSIQNSHSIGVYLDKVQIGFARWVTDGVVTAHLSDLFVVEEHRGVGIGQKMIDYCLNHESVKDVKSVTLRTSDAHDLYEKFGFVLYKEDGRTMKLIRIKDDLSRVK